MASPIERATMYAAALLDKTPTEAQLRQLAEAYARRAPADEIMRVFGKPYEELGDTEKALILLEMLNREATANIRYVAEQAASAQLAESVGRAGDAAEALFRGSV